MEAGREQVVAFRLARHHLHERLPVGLRRHRRRSSGCRTRRRAPPLLALAARSDAAPEELDELVVALQPPRGADGCGVAGPDPCSRSGLAPPDEAAAKALIGSAAKAIGERHRAGGARPRERGGGRRAGRRAAGPRRRSTRRCASGCRPTCCGGAGAATAITCIRRCGGRPACAACSPSSAARGAARCSGCRRRRRPVEDPGARAGAPLPARLRPRRDRRCSPPGPGSRPRTPRRCGSAPASSPRSRWTARGASCSPRTPTRSPTRRPPTGVRLLPNLDPLLGRARPRAADPRRGRAQARVEDARRAGGRARRRRASAALWRPAKKGKRLVVTVEPLGPLGRAAEAALGEEAERLAPFRGATTGEVALAA